MKFSISIAIMMGVVLSVAGFLAVLLSRELAPPPLMFEGVGVVDAITEPGGQIVVRAQVRSEVDPLGACVTGVQAFARSSSGEIDRLTQPEKSLRPDGQSEYVVTIRPDSLPGSYGLRIRETINCGRPVAVDTPWLDFRVEGKAL